MNINIFIFLCLLYCGVAIPRQSKYPVNLLDDNGPDKRVANTDGRGGNGEEYDNDERVKFNNDNIDYDTEEEENDYDDKNLEANNPVNIDEEVSYDDDMYLKDQQGEGIIDTDDSSDEDDMIDLNDNDGRILNSEDGHIDDMADAEDGNYDVDYEEEINEDVYDDATEGTNEDPVNKHQWFIG
ncbi:hypothetical protein CDAR_466161 [Caerostris darwini]|uniref:Prostatic spermine-binding protein-like n=1 Tax=Caerostris darwini TaxID=1538125 RepID=A0AAV4Q6J1_9ARAC|nr:hypothetical protein CDAR_466161 [Caerostris darwini]